MGKISAAPQGEELVASGAQNIICNACLRHQVRTLMRIGTLMLLEPTPPPKIRTSQSNAIEIRDVIDIFIFWLVRQ